MNRYEKLHQTELYVLLELDTAVQQYPGAIADVASSAVLRNNVIVGSVNANKRHWYRAAQYLARADRAWLSKLITRKVKAGKF